MNRRTHYTGSPTPPPKPPLTAAPAQARKSRGRGKKLAVILPVILAGAAAVSVGAAAYTRDGSHDSAAAKAPAVESVPAKVVQHDAMPDEGLRGRAADQAAAAPSGTSTVPAKITLDSSSLSPAAAKAFRLIKLDAGALAIGQDPMGVSQTSLPLHVTNTGGQVKSFDITVVARAADGATITKDIGTAAHLQPGQSAEVRVLDIVNDTMTESLKSATFAVTDVFAY